MDGPSVAVGMGCTRWDLLDIVGPCVAGESRSLPEEKRCISPWNANGAANARRPGGTSRAARPYENSPFRRPLHHSRNAGPHRRAGMLGGPGECACWDAWPGRPDDRPRTGVRMAPRRRRLTVHSHSGDSCTRITLLVAGGARGPNRECLTLVGGCAGRTCCGWRPVRAWQGADLLLWRGDVRQDQQVHGGDGYLVEPDGALRALQQGAD